MSLSTPHTNPKSKRSFRGDLKSARRCAQVLYKYYVIVYKVLSICRFEDPEGPWSPSL
jgi:hypothetical protein